MQARPSRLFKTTINSIIHKNSQGIIDPGEILSQLLQDYSQKKRYQKYVGELSQPVTSKADIHLAKQLLGWLKPKQFPKLFHAKNPPSKSLFAKREANLDIHYFIKHLNEHSYLIPPSSKLCQLLGAFFSIYLTLKIKLSTDLNNRFETMDVLNRAIVHTTDSIMDNPNKDKSWQIHKDLNDFVSSFEAWMPDEAKKKLGKFFAAAKNNIHENDTINDYAKHQRLIIILKYIIRLKEWILPGQREEIIEGMMPLLEFFPNDKSFAGWLSPEKAKHFFSCLMKDFCQDAFWVKKRRACVTIGFLRSCIPMDMREEVIRAMIDCTKHPVWYVQDDSVKVLDECFDIIPNAMKDEVINTFIAKSACFEIDPNLNFKYIFNIALKGLERYKSHFITTNRFLDVSALLDELKTTPYIKLKNMIIRSLAHLPVMIAPNMRIDIINVLLSMLKNTELSESKTIKTIIVTLSQWREFCDTNTQKQFIDTLFSILQNYKTFTRDSSDSMLATLFTTLGQWPNLTSVEMDMMLQVLVTVLDGKDKKLVNQTLKAIGQFTQIDQPKFAAIITILVEKLKHSDYALAACQALASLKKIMPLPQKTEMLIMKLLADDKISYILMKDGLWDAARELISYYKRTQVLDEFILNLIKNESLDYLVNYVRYPNITTDMSPHLKVHVLCLCKTHLSQVNHLFEYAEIVNRVYSAYRCDVAKSTLKCAAAEGLQLPKEVIENRIMAYRF